jgi:hypothetical protein
MPQYVIERDVPGTGLMTELEVQEVSLRSLDVLKEWDRRFSGSTAT